MKCRLMPTSRSALHTGSSNQSWSQRRAPHLGGGRSEADAMPGAAECQQVSVAAGRRIEECARAGLVIDRPVAIARDQQERCGDRAQAVGAPGVEGSARRRHAHDRLHGVNAHRFARVAATGVGLHQSTRHQPGSGSAGIELAARRRQHAESAHRIADERDARSIDAVARRRAHPAATSRRRRCRAGGAARAPENFARSVIAGSRWRMAATT